ncbi:hypothetical protein KGA65_07515 [Ideonella sp. B7]|nr:hypothetical protein [Ideonella benzenivorans]MCA6216384.1 hypothetical protein [Ideonella benzenivorans]
MQAFVGDPPAMKLWALFLIKAPRLGGVLLGAGGLGGLLHELFRYFS